MNRLYVLLFFALAMCTCATVNATNPIGVQSHFLENTSETESKNEGVFRKAKTWIKKKIAAEFSSDKALRYGRIALTLGILSLLSWALVALTNGWILYLIVAFAISGDIISIMTLWNTRRAKKENKKARRMAWWGLVFSLLTGLAPLVLFLLILAAL
jgi:hypothetical protein